MSSIVNNVLKKKYTQEYRTLPNASKHSLLSEQESRRTYGTAVGGVVIHLN